MPRPLITALVAATALAACAGAASPAPSPIASPPGSPTPAGSPSSGGSPSAGGSSGQAVEVTGVEYRFEGVPASVPAGTTFSFRNGGSEVHEMVIARKLPETTEDWQELLQLPPEQALEKVSIAGGTQAAPGQAAPNPITVNEPGEYAMLCFIPVGTTSLPSPGEPSPSVALGPPHFTQGMIAEFTVEP